MIWIYLGVALVLALFVGDIAINIMKTSPPRFRLTYLLGLEILTALAVGVSLVALVVST